MSDGRTWPHLPLVVAPPSFFFFFFWQLRDLLEHQFRTLLVRMRSSQPVSFSSLDKTVTTKVINPPHHPLSPPVSPPSTTSLTHLLSLPTPHPSIQPPSFPTSDPKQTRINLMTITYSKQKVSIINTQRPEHLRASQDEPLPIDTTIIVTQMHATHVIPNQQRQNESQP